MFDLKGGKKVGVRETLGRPKKKDHQWSHVRAFIEWGFHVFCFQLHMGKCHFFE